MKKYKADSILPTIKCIEITSESEKQVSYINSFGRKVRESKMSSYSAWFDTFDEAKAYLFSVQNDRIEGFERNIEHCNDIKSRIANIEKC